MRLSNRCRSLWFVAIVIAAVSLFSPGAFAKPVAKEDAEKAVSGWLKQPGRGLKAPIGNAVKETQVFTDAAGKPEYYVVYLKPSGFVIVPADDLVEPIICFCPAGRYVASDKNPLGALVTRDIPGRLALARAKQPAQAGKPAGALQARMKDAQQKWEKFEAAATAGPLTSPPTSVSDVRVAPLTQTTWSQSDAGDDTSIACYNYYTPPGPNGNVNNYVCGCVATAMAQLMRFYDYPTAGVGTVSSYYYVDGREHSADLRGGNGSGGPYDWADMVLSPSGSITTTQCEAIGALCYDAGIAAHMQYDMDGENESGAYMSDASTALKNVFQYNNSICGGDGSDNIGAGLTTMLNSNLDAGLPCLLGIFGPDGGHAPIADGYGYDSGTLYDHLNMGWSGEDNGWYNLPVFTAGYPWTTVDNCIYNIYITGNGEIVSGRLVDTSGNPIAGATVTATGTGGPYTATTNGTGIYSFAKIPSNTTYTLSASAAGYAFSPGTLTATTGLSSNSSNSTGNVWGENFTGTVVYPLTVQSTPPTGVVISSTTGDGGTTNYSVSTIASGASVSLQAPAADPAGWYTFSQWTLNGVAQTPGQQSLTFTMTAATTAVAQYTLNTYALNVQSTPPTGLSVGSSTGHAGTTNYTITGVGAGTSVNLQAPAADPAGWYTFSQWTLNGVAQTSGQQSLTFTMTAATAAVAQYTLNTYTLNVQSTPPTGLSIGSSTGHSGTTNYTITGVGAGTSVNLEAPAADPAGWYTFSQWTLNGVAQTPGQQAITFTMTVATTVVAQYTLNTYALNVQSTPPTGLSVGSSTGHAGTTNYTIGAVGAGTSVNLQAPMADSAGSYTFSQWTLNGVAQTPGQQAITFTMTVATTAVAQYTLNTYALNVQSTPPTGLVIGSSTGHAGTTNYTITGVGAGTSVNLQAPAADPAGWYTFSQWTLNGVAQTPGQQSLTFTMTAATTAVAQYTLNTYTLNVQSTPPTGLVIGSSTGHAGTTNYTIAGVGAGTSVNLQAPAADPAGWYTFSQWTLNGVAQTPGQQSLTFTMTAATAAVAQYTLNTYALNVQSTPPTGLSVGSSTGHAGTTNYTIGAVGAGTSVNLQAPASDPAGWYTFSQWTLNGVAQTPGQQAITFTMTVATTAVAQYTLNTYMLNVQSTPPTGLVIGSSTGHGGTTNYSKTGVAYGTSVNLQAPGTDPTGYAFAQWAVNGTGQTAGQKSITFTMTAATTAAAQYNAVSGSYTLTVQSTPPTGVVVSSSTGDGGTTNYSISTIASGASVNLQAPATDPTGYAFAQWSVNGTGQTAGQKSITFTMAAATTAVAEYNTVSITSYTLTVQSTPPTGIVVSSSTGDGGTTNYSISTIASGASVNLQAPATDPTGYTFSEWTVNSAAQPAGQKTVTFPMNEATTAVAKYTTNTSFTLTVQSTPPTGLVIGSSTGHSGTTNYSKTGQAYGTSVSLQAPGTDPTGYTFLQWAVNSAAQPAGQKSVTCTMDAAVTAVAQYTLNGYTLTVQSTPPTKLVIGSSTGQGGTTNYSVTWVGFGTSINLQAPATDPAGYTFLWWTVNGAAQAAGQKAITFTMDAALTAVAEYTPTGYALTVQSTPPTKLVIGSSTGQGGTTNYSVSPVSPGASVNLQAPGTDPAGYTFLQWAVNSAAQPAGQKAITFTMDAALTAVAQYTPTGYALTVQSTPPTKLVIGSSTGQGGTTNYSVPLVSPGASVNLQAPATDPAGYTFLQWLVNSGAAGAAGQKGITLTMTAAATAVAQYTVTGYALTVQSTPPTKLVIGSSTGQGGTTNYSVPLVGSGASVNLQAPATDPAGYTFLWWTVNSGAQPAGQKSVTFTMEAALTAVAQYTPSGYALTVQSTPPTGLVIGSSTGQGGTTNYSVSLVSPGASVNLVAPATDPAGYTFLQWVVNNGAAGAAGQKGITFTMTAATTAVAQYTQNGCTLTVQSTPPTKLEIGSSTGQSGTTNYSVPGVPPGGSVNLQAPATDPAGYTFVQWTVNNAAQAAGQKSVTFTMDAALTAVAQYTENGYTLTAQSTPPTGLVIASSTGQNGTTNYSVAGVPAGTSVNLQAPATDPAGYTFVQWMVSGAAQPAGQKSVTFTMDAALTAVAAYTLNGYTLTVQSTPPTGLVIGSSTGQGGTTNYTVSGVACGTSVNLQAPATDPAGYTFLQWMIGDAAQPAGQKSVTLTVDAALTAVAQYTLSGYALTVESTPPTGLSIGSSTGQKGTTNYCINTGVAAGTGVNLQAPATDPTGYTFLQWTVNGAGQGSGVKTITFTMPASATAVAQYTPNGYTLTVQSTPPTGLSISSSTGQGGTTNYTVSSVAYGTSVNLVAPATDPAGYTFVQWMVSGAAQPAGQKATTFTMDAALTAVAQYALSGYTLTVQSTPPTGLVIGSSTGQGGTTNYSKTGIAYGTSVNLVAPATDPAGYTFLQWTVNSAAQAAGQKSVTITMDGTLTAVAQYSLNGYTLTVQSTPPTGLVIGSSTGQSGTTNYSVPGVAYGTSVNLQAPATDPAGYTFVEWKVNNAAQATGQKSVTFTMDAALTAVAQYTLNGYALTVQSTPPTKLVIGSSTGQGGTTNYSVSLVASGASVNLQAPATDPVGYTFLQWTVNSAAQPAGQKATTFTMDAAVTAVAQYTMTGYALTVQSTPPTGLVIGSSTGQGGTTNYSVSLVASGASVNLQAPATDPVGYTFLQWTVSGGTQAAGQKSVTFTMDAAATAVAQYSLNAYALTVQSTPPTKLVIGSSTGQGGTTNYSVPLVASGTSVNLQAPATDPVGYTFLQWTVNSAAQPAGQKAITFTMDAAVTAVAQYTPNGYALTVQSTPPTGLVTGSSTGQGGTTNYSVALISTGTSVTLQAPGTDPTGYTFLQWTLNSAAQPAGQKAITFTMDAAVTAVAQYSLNGYTLTVQSTPPTGLSISSSTGQNGTTSYTVPNVAYGTSVNLQAPGTDPAGYTFLWWTLNSAAQAAGQKAITFMMDTAVTAVAQYTASGYTLTVQSTPATGLSVSSSTGQSGKTNYTIAGVAGGMSVNLQAPATDPAGYTFLVWTVNNAAQLPGQKAITFTMDGAVTAVAQYTLNFTYVLTVQSTPPTKLVIGSSTGQGGTTNYTVAGVAYGVSINLQAPATDPAGYIFSQWAVNGAAQPAGQKTITFTMTGTTTAVAQYVSAAGAANPAGNTHKGQKGTIKKGP